MLQSLYIKNFVLIKEINLDFSQGFSVITGETGAGKSILLGALNLVLGARSDVKYISEGEEKCIIEAVFQIKSYQLAPFFEENDLDYSDECVLRRELYRSGKTRQFLNDSPVSASVLKTLSALFIDIHSQHENLLLRDGKFQLKVVDTYAKNDELLQAYQQAYHHYKNACKQVEEAEQLAAKAQEEYDYLQFQFDQLDKAKLQAGELEALEAENELLEHAHDIKNSLLYIEALLQDENGVVSRLKDASNKVGSIASFATDYQDWAARLESSYIEIKDIASDISSGAERIEANPAQLEANRERLDTLYSLLQKHKVKTVEELIDLRNQLEAQLQQISQADQHIEALKKEQAAALATTQKLANELHQIRQKVAQPIAEVLKEQLKQLGMQHATVQVSVQEQPAFTGMGKDVVEFLYAPTPTTTPQPAGKIASGGEIARFMLCIKYLLANATQLPTLIFDEIDTGISGETASLMGSMLQKMSHSAQIICITHLPQIAALGNQHYFVHKVEGEEILTNVSLLSDEQRVTAIAKMLSGTSITDAAMQNAQALLDNRN